MFINIMKRNKVLLENFISLSFLKILNLTIPFLVLPIVLNVIGVEAYGKVALILAINTYFLALTSYGFSLSATRDISKYRASKIKVRAIYYKVLACKIYLYCVSILGMFIFEFYFGFFGLDYFISFAILLFGQTFFPDWYFRGVEKMRYITFYDSISKVAFVIFVLTCLSDKNDGLIYLLAMGITQSFITISSNFSIAKKIGFKSPFVSLKRFTKELCSNFPLFLNQFLPNLYSNTSILIVGYLLGTYAAGVFAVLRQVCSLYSVFNNVLSMTFFPSLSNRKDKFKKIARVYFLLSIIFLVFMISISPLIPYFFDIEYKGMYICYLIMIFGVFMVSVYSIFSTNYLIIHKRDSDVTKLTFFASLSGLVFSYPMISQFELIGASISIFLGQFLMALGSIYYARRYAMNHFEERK
ncbi:oligosaccharide flippase family protein [Vibrio vulnificus]|uniref:oligosaccharide flippase family protein n=1 Tax=Vibrio vulnificus TaxID=672 RepID=UPI003EDA8800